MASLTYPVIPSSNCAGRLIPAAEFSPEPHALQIFHKIPAGFPSPAADYTAEPLDLNQYLVDRVTCTFFFEVDGHSLKQAGIFHGDKVAVDRSIPPRSGHVVLAIVNDEFTLKILHWTGMAYELHPANDDFQPIRFKEGEQLQIFGVARGVVRKLL